MNRRTPHPILLRACAASAAALTAAQAGPACAQALQLGLAGHVAPRCWSAPSAAGDLPKARCNTATPRLSLRTRIAPQAETALTHVRTDTPRRPTHLEVLVTPVA